MHIMLLSGSCSTPNAYQAQRGGVDFSEGRAAALSPSKKMERRKLLSSIMKDPNALTGFSKEELVTVFASPMLERGEGSNVVYHYETETCVLDAYFQGLRNESLASRQLMRVAYVDMHRKQKAKTIMDKKGSDSASLVVAPLSLSEKKACFKALSSGQQVERLGGVFVAEQDQDAHAG